MKTATTHRARALLLALLLTGLGCAAAAQVGSSAQSVPQRAAAYGWPVKPFDHPHPVRGSFGDPRTIFSGPPTQKTLLTGIGSFSFHFGIDIAVPDGTPVYPVESGTVETVTREWVGVRCGGGRSFQYWHVAATVRVGQPVTAGVTVLGRVLRGCGHVHFSELNHGVFVNPLQPGHLEPYADTTTPVVRSVAFVDPGGGDLLPELLRGRVEIVVAADDLPALPVAGEWHNLPVTPARIEWRIVRAATGKVVVPTRVAFDVRRSLPAPDAFWRVYARGTHQNMSVFGKHYSYMQPGVYRFRLTPGGFDTRKLRDEVYELVVTATDIRGNHATLSQRFSVHNRPGDVGV